MVDFKRVNNTRRHPGGDELITVVGHRLQLVDVVLSAFAEPVDRSHGCALLSRPVGRAGLNPVFRSGFGRFA